VCFDPSVDIASFVIACVSALMAIVAVWYSRGQKKIAEAAKEEARRSADAAAVVAQIERERRDEEITAIEQNRVFFDLKPKGGDRFLIAHEGNASAFGVHIDVNQLGWLEISDFEEWEPGDKIEFFAIRSAASGSHILVTWHQQSDRSDLQRSQKLHP